MRRMSIAGAARSPSALSTPSALRRPPIGNVFVAVNEAVEERVERARPWPVDRLYGLGLLEPELGVGGGGEEGEDRQRRSTGRSGLPPLKLGPRRRFRPCPISEGSLVAVVSTGTRPGPPWFYLLAIF